MPGTATCACCASRLPASPASPGSEDPVCPLHGLSVPRAQSGDWRPVGLQGWMSPAWVLSATIPLTFQLHAEHEPYARPWACH